MPDSSAEQGTERLQVEAKPLFSRFRAARADFWLNAIRSRMGPYFSGVIVMGGGVANSGEGVGCGTSSLEEQLNKQKTRR